MEYSFNINRTICNIDFYFIRKNVQNVLHSFIIIIIYKILNF